jgi:hypothetical protein
MRRRWAIYDIFIAIGHDPVWENSERRRQK